MSENKIMGVVSVVARNVDTGEIEYSKEYRNAVAFSALREMIITNGTFGTLSLAFFTIPGVEFRAVAAFGINATTANVGIASGIPGVAGRLIVNTTDSSPGYIQYSGRQGPPTLGSTRTIASVHLCQAASSGVGYNSGLGVHLTVPCIQQDNQTLDVYYRLYFSNDQLEAEQVNEWMRWMNTGNATKISGWLVDSIPTISKKYARTSNAIVPHYLGPTAWSSSVSHNHNSLGQVASLSGSGLGEAATTSISVNTEYLLGRIISGTSLLLFDGTYNLAGPISSSRCAIPISSEKVQANSSIGAVIPHSPASTRMMYDIDAFPVGSGKVISGGTWEQYQTPATPGLYHSAKFPSMYIVDITASGELGSSTYKWRKNAFFGSVSTSWLPVSQEVPGLQYSPASMKKTMWGDPATVTIDMLSGISAYNGTSVVLLNRNRITIYNIASGDYWVYDGSYTKPSQVVVIGDDIWVNCRDTGLYRINPRTESAFTKVEPVGMGLTACYGVARGFNNSLWAVSTTGVLHFDGVTWAKYDSGSAPSFTVADIIANYSTVAYIKVNAQSANNDVLLVRDATTAVANFGVWWNTVVGGSGTPTWSGSNTYGLQLNKQFINTHNNEWFIMENTGLVYRTPFGSSTRPTSSMATAETGGNGLRRSIVHIDTVDGVNMLLRSDNVAAAVYGNSAISASSNNISYERTQFSYHRDGSTSINAAMTHTGPTHVDLSMNGFASTTVNGRTANHFSSVKLANGLLLSMSFSSTRCEAHITPYTFGKTLDSRVINVGSMQYGWDGSGWVEGGATGRPTHATPEILDAGVAIRFENGISAPSFSQNDYYNFVVCDGVFKDNATTLSMTHTLHLVPGEKLSAVEDVIVGSRNQSYPIGYIDKHPSLSTSLTKRNTDLTFGYAIDSGDVAVNITGVRVVGDKKVTGDFEISWDYNSSTQFVGLRVGICNMLGHFVTGFAIQTANNILYFDPFNQNPDLNLSPNLSSVTAAGTTTLGIRKIGTTLNLLRNGAVIKTYNAIAQKEFWIVHESGATTSHTTTSNSKTFAAQIVSNGVSTGLRMGNSVAQTGYFHPKFFKIDANSIRNVKLDGLNVALIKTDATDPNPGEVSIDVNQGLMYFNIADAGKTVTAEYTALYLP